MVKKIKIILGLVFILLVLPMILAADKCCKQDNNDVICSEYPSDQIANNCPAENIHSGLCNEITDCTVGCCQGEEGLCTSGSRKQQCLNDGGEWDWDDSCNIQVCQEGCCTFGGQGVFTTEKNCQIRADSFGFQERTFISGMSQKNAH